MVARHDEILINATARGRWTLRVTPGDVASARDSLARLEELGCVDPASAHNVRTLLNVVENMGGGAGR
jgi:hypothetical protein